MITPPPFSFVTMWRSATQSVGELAPWQMLNMAPFLSDGQSRKRDRITRPSAQERTLQMAAKREKAHEKKERKRAARRVKKNPRLTPTVTFKSFPAQRREQHTKKLLGSLTESLENMAIQQLPTENTILLEDHRVGKTGRRRINSVVNSMSEIFATQCQLSPPPNTPLLDDIGVKPMTVS